MFHPALKICEGSPFLVPDSRSYLRWTFWPRDNFIAKKPGQWLFSQNTLVTLSHGDGLLLYFLFHCMSAKALRFYNLKIIEVIWTINFWVPHSLDYRLSIGSAFYTINVSKKKSSLAFVSSSLEEAKLQKECQWELLYTDAKVSVGNLAGTCLD